MYRTNAQSRVIEEALVAQRLPYRLIGGTRFYQRREIKDVLAYLRLIANEADEVSLRRVLNVPKRGIGDRAEEYVAAYAQQKRETFAWALAPPAAVPGLAGRSANALAGFNTLLKELGALSEPGSVVVRPLALASAPSNCRSCGAELKGAKFCPECGAKAV